MVQPHACDSGLCCPQQARSHLLLDLGCGSGISGAQLSATNHAWIGCDISLDMLNLAQGNAQASNAVQSRQGLANSAPAAPAMSSRTGYNELNHRHGSDARNNSKSPCSKGLVFQSDMACGIPIRADSIEGVISISAVQWLCHLPEASLALSRLFKDLYRCLKPNCKAVLQVYLTGSLAIAADTSCSVASV